MSIPRHALSSNCIHVTQRGVGKRIIFEDDADKRRFLRTLSFKLEDSDVEILAWCLMDNHFHLLVNAELDDLSKLMQRVSISYAQHFNGRHGHIGKLYQGRYRAQAITTNEHLLAAIRYIHLNCRDMDDADPRYYPWSSYRECVGCKDVEGLGICHIEKTVALFDGIEDFARFHEESNEISANHDFSNSPSRMTNLEAQCIAVQELGPDYSNSLIAMPRTLRNESLKRLKARGLSIRQIERLTGIGKNIIARA